MANPENYQAPAELARLRTLALGVGGIATIIVAVGAYFNTEQALRSWLLGFIFWSGLCFGFKRHRDFRPGDGGWWIYRHVCRSICDYFDRPAGLQFANYGDDYRHREWRFDPRAARQSGGGDGQLGVYEQPADDRHGLG